MEIAEQMAAYRLLLTHFSQRYSRVPTLETSHWASERLAVAFDLMQLTLASLPWLPRSLTAVRAVLGRSDGRDRGDVAAEPVRLGVE